MEKAIIIIAVSKYLGMSPLPGTIFSAKRIAQWAEREGYRRLFLTDHNTQFPQSDINDPVIVDQAVTVDWCKRQIPTFLNQPVDRLVIYFAGHGMTMPPASPIWLLSNATQSDEEGIKVDALRRGLERYGLGKFNPDLFKGQVSIIADCCRNVTALSEDFEGHKILTSRGQNRTPYHLDLFNATLRGEETYQVNATNDTEAFCIFSDTLADALEGKEVDAIEVVPQSEPMVTSQRLEQCLFKRVPARMQEKFGKTVNPDVNGVFHPPHNVYSTVNATSSFEVNQDSSVTPSVVAELLVERARMEQPSAVDNVSNGGATTMGLESVAPSVSSTSLGENFIDISLKTDLLYEHFSHTWNPRSFRWTSDIEPDRICIHKSGAVEKLETQSDSANRRLISYQCDAEPRFLPIFIRVNKSWIMIPNIPSRLPYYYSKLPNDLLFFNATSQSWDLTMSSYFSNRAGAALRYRDATNLADSIRTGKAEDPYRAILAGYLYEGLGDTDNIARTAHYMVRDGYNGPNRDKLNPFLAFDLALLCAVRAHYRTDSYNIPRIWVDLPGVSRVPELVSAFERRRPYYAATSFRPKINVPTIGIIPTFRAGWEFLETASDLSISEPLLDLKGHLMGTSVTVFNEEGMRQFAERFDFKYE